MATTEEVLNWLQESFELTEHEPGIVSFEMFYGDARKQQVIVFLEKSEIRVLSPFAAVESISAEQALDANDSNFGVAINSGFFFLSHVFYLSSSEVQKMMFPIVCLATEAMQLRENLVLD
jgi:hypothetical protein